MSTLFFLHIPKTGGTSIRHAASRVFSPHEMMMLYGPGESINDPYAEKVWFDRPELAAAEKFELLSDHIVRNRFRFCSSHIDLAALPCFDPGRAFTMFRDPCEQVVSLYVFSRKRNRTSEPFEAFIERPQNQNTQRQHLGSADLDRLALVGVLDEFQPFVDALNRRFGANFAKYHSNRRGVVARFTGPVLDPALRARVLALNALDVDLYRRAREAWARTRAA